MTQPQSPAARAIWEAYERADCDPYQIDPRRAGLASALRALADQAGSAKHWHVNELRAIAAELESDQ